MTKYLLSMLTIATILQAQTIGVTEIQPVNIDEAQARALTDRIRGAIADHGPAVDRGKALQEVLVEHGLRMAGIDPDDSLGLTTADMIISGSAGASALDRWFIDLCLTDVTSGRVITCRHATTTCFKDLITISKTVAKALVQGTPIENADTNRYLQDPPILIGTHKSIQEVHVYEHKAGTHGVKRFIPCPYCQGTGKIPCRTCPNSGEKDCPACSITSLYKGSETHGEYLTGHWQE